MLFPWERSVWQNPMHIRTNQNDQIYVWLPCHTIINDISLIRRLHLFYLKRCISVV